MKRILIKIRNLFRLNNIIKLGKYFVLTIVDIILSPLALYYYFVTLLKIIYSSIKKLVVRVFKLELIQVEKNKSVYDLNKKRNFIAQHFVKYWLVIIPKYIRSKFGRISLEAFSISLLALFFFPFFMVIINSAKDDTEILRNPMNLPTSMIGVYYNVLEILSREKIDYLNSFYHSVIITSASLILIGVFSAMAAWVLVRTKTRFSFVIFLFFLSGLVFPFQVVMLPLVRLLSTLKDITGIPFKDTYWGVIGAYIGFGAPLSIFLFHGFIKSIPMDIEEAAIIDGCSKSQVFFKVILPILKPIFVTLLVLNGLWIWNDYLLPVLIIGVEGDIQTLPLAVAGLAGFYDKEWALILTSVLMASLPVVILFLFAQKHIIKGMTSGAIK